MYLKVVLLFRASCNSYLGMEPQRISTLSYGIRLLAIYDLKVELQRNSMVENPCVCELITFHQALTNVKCARNILLLVLHNFSSRLNGSESCAVA